MGRLLIVVLAVSSIAASVDDTAKEVLRTRDFRFCQPSEDPLWAREREWCEIADDATTCPELKEMCARPAPDEGMGGLFGGGKNGEKGDEPETGLFAGNEGIARRLLPNVNLSWLPWVLWALVGLAIALVLFFVLRQILDRHAQTRDESAETPDLKSHVTHELAPQGLGEVGSLLRRARDEAERDVSAAFAFLYAAVLKQLEIDRLIQWDSSTTNREYVRSVRGRTPLDRPLADIVREVERAKFGQRPPSRASFDELYQRVASSLQAAGRVAALLVALLLGACNCQGDAGLYGRAAFTEIVASQGIEPKSFKLPLDQLTGDAPPVLVDGQSFRINAEVLHALEVGMLGGARILLLLDRTQSFDAWPELTVADGLGGPLTPTREWAQAAGVDGVQGRVPGDLALTISPNERDAPEVLLERGGQPFAVRWRSERGQLLVVADRDLFSNGAMAVPANARLAVALAREVAGDGGTLAYAAIGPTKPAETPAESLGRAGLWALMVQALLVVALVFWGKGAAFGTLRDRSQRKRREFREHVAALGVQLSRRHGSRLAAGLYAGYALDRLWQRTGREAVRHDPASLARVLAPRLGEDEAELRRLLEHADDVRRHPDGVASPERDLALIRRLGELLAR